VQLFKRSFFLKNKKHTLCLLNLVLFLSSFTLLSLNSLSASANPSASHSYKQYNAKPDGIVNSSAQQLSEKNETENETESEDGSELHVLALPFFFSCLQSGTIRSYYKPAAIFSGQFLNPIYISVHNFRI
jgi:hypothetical protein